MGARPSEPVISAQLRGILQLARSSPFAPVPLGKLHGNIMCALEPEDCIGSDIETYTPGREGFALSPSFYDAICAINYADGHPSENEYLLKRLATEDKTLRQFVSLGWVMIKTNGPWIKTGHALVIDASHHRKCHPWFVSARQLETDSEDDFQKYDTDIMEPATKVKKKNDRNALGVFPGNNNRTPIARLTHFGWAPEGEEKFVSHFGVDFNFEFDRLVGIPDDEIRGEWGPDLVQILDWWWDPIKQEEVCYTHDEKECMRYNPSTREYNDPHALLEERVGIILED